MDVTQQQLRHSDGTAPHHGGTRGRFINVRHDKADDLSIFEGFPPPAGEIAAQLVFGGCGFEQVARAHMSGAPWPVLWVQGDVCSGTHLSGTQAYVVEDRPFGRVKLADQVVGSKWQDDDADYCLLAGILPVDSKQTRGAQTTSCMEQIETALHKAGMDFSHIVRTWFYLDQLLAWYDEFNAARTGFFESRNVFDRLIPASTGIGARNPAGAALVAGALAIRPRHQRVHVQEVPSPLQCPATEYRSSFSRAVEVAFPDRRMLIISGTASIAPEGESMFTNDCGKQIHLTLDVVEAILKSRDMDWSDTVRAVGYFRDMKDVPLFEKCRRDRGIPPLPLTPAHTIVCRDDLLFEIELDAVSTAALEKGVTGDTV